MEKRWDANQKFHVFEHLSPVPGADRCLSTSLGALEAVHTPHAAIERLSCQRCCSPGERPVRTAEPFRSSASYVGQRCESEKRASTCVYRQDAKLTSSRAYHAARTIPPELLWGAMFICIDFPGCWHPSLGVTCVPGEVLASLRQRGVCAGPAASRLHKTQRHCPCGCRKYPTESAAKEQGAGHCARCRVLPTTYRQADVQVRCVAIVAAMQASAGKSAALQPHWRPSPSLVWCGCASGFDGTQLVA